MYLPISDWFPAFLLTLAIEAPIVAFLLRRVEPDLTLTWAIRFVPSL